MSFYEMLKDKDNRTKHVFDVLNSISTTPSQFDDVAFEQAFLKALFMECQIEVEIATGKLIQIMKAIKDTAPFSVLRATSILESVATDLSDTGIVAQQAPEKDRYLVRYNAVSFLKQLTRTAPELLPSILISTIATKIMNNDPSLAVASSAIYLKTEWSSDQQLEARLKISGRLNKTKKKISSSHGLKVS